MNSILLSLSFLFFLFFAGDAFGICPSPFLLAVLSTAEAVDPLHLFFLLLLLLLLLLSSFIPFLFFPFFRVSPLFEVSLTRLWRLPLETHRGTPPVLKNSGEGARLTSQLSSSCIPVAELQREGEKKRKTPRVPSRLFGLPLLLSPFHSFPRGRPRCLAS